MDVDLNQALRDPALRAFLSNSGATRHRLVDLGLMSPNGELSPISERALRNVERALELCPQLHDAKMATIGSKEDSDAKRALMLEVLRKQKTQEAERLRKNCAKERERRKTLKEEAGRASQS